MTLSFAPDAIETWPLSSLQPYAKNAKAHGADQVAKIAASMAEFGWTVPCLVAEDGELIAGHGRVLAATQLGLTEAPVIVLGHLTEAQRRAYRIADNKLTELGTWDEALLSAELNDLLAEDFDLSLVGFSDGELDKLLAYVAEGDGEEGGAGGSVPPVTIPEPPRNPASRTGDLWILGDHRLLCGDSTSAADVRRLMNGERAILFATDPPYLVDYDGSNHPTRNKDWSPSYGTTWDDSSQGAELYDGFIAAAVAEAIAEDAAWYCWHASRRQAMLEACWEKAGAFVHQQIIWVKDRGVLTRSHYLWKHEPCFMGWRRPNRPPKVAEETLPSTWALPSFAKDERPDHPTPKPLDAFGIPMRQHVARGGLCYEPFSGSGSQIMAGEANGRRVFAMEISPAYVDVAVERWQAETGRDAILDGDGRTFAQVRTERLGDDADAPADTPDSGRRPRTRAKAQDRRVRPCMTWLYLPPDALPEPETHASSASLSAPARAGSTSGSPSPSPDIVLWAMSSGKPSPQPLSWRGWKTRPWIRLLSGTTLEPSTAARGAARWTSSLRAIRASRSRSRASAGRGRPAPPLAACRPHHRRGRAALRLPRECRPSSPPRLPRSRQRTGRHGLQPCGRPLHGGGSRRAPQARAAVHPRHPRGRRAGRPRAPAPAPGRVAGTGPRCCGCGRRTATDSKGGREPDRRSGRPRRKRASARDEPLRATRSGRRRRPTVSAAGVASGATRRVWTGWRGTGRRRWRTTAASRARATGGQPI